MRNKPIFQIRRGFIKVRVWRKRTKSGVRHTTTAVRLYRNGDVWKESARFGRDDIQVVRLLLDKAFAWIYQQFPNDTP